jgi:uncharacterized protein YehS (DUF1456 family)
LNEEKFLIISPHPHSFSCPKISLIPIFNGRMRNKDKEEGNFALGSLGAIPDNSLLEKLKISSKLITFDILGT